MLAGGCALLTLLWGCAAMERAAGEQTIRVMTYNIHHGMAADGTFDLRRIAKAIRNSDAEIVALQDVDRGTLRSHAVDELTMLADLTNMTYTFAGSDTIDAGEHGNGLLTRFPILEEKPVLFSLRNNTERCGLMRLVLDVNGISVVVMNTELSGGTGDTVQRAYVSELLDYAKGTVNVPTMLFASVPPTSDSSTFAPLMNTFTDCWTRSGFGDGATYPSSRPDQRIDFIFVSKPFVPTDTKSPEIRLQPVGAEVLRDSASDHRPLVATVKIATD
jgi:endonuclease/exonuclease/phosphatase family metal-dependent hydrolase